MLLLNLVILLSLVVSTLSCIPCEDPSKYVGEYVSSDFASDLGLGKESAALVQYKCHRQPGKKQIGVTASWTRGIRVRDNCSKIPKLTAIATFLGPNNSYNEPKYRQHTAIFVKCEDKGIRVWNQWNLSNDSKPLGFRLIEWIGTTIQYSGNNFWTIADDINPTCVPNFGVRNAIKLSVIFGSFIVGLFLTKTAV